LQKPKRSYGFIGSSTVYDMKTFKDQLQLFMVSSECVKGLFKWQTLQQLKLAQLDKVLDKWCTTVCSEGKLVTRSIIIEKANSFYNEMKITSWLLHPLWGQ